MTVVPCFRYFELLYIWIFYIPGDLKFRVQNNLHESNCVVQRFSFFFIFKLYRISFYALFLSMFSTQASPANVLAAVKRWRTLLWSRPPSHPYRGRSRIFKGQKTALHFSEWRLNNLSENQLKQTFLSLADLDLKWLHFNQ